MGTPRTGIVVFAAITPGRAAAPPAPAIITSIPLEEAEDEYSVSSSGALCAEITLVSYEIFKRSSVSEDLDIVSQSEADPIIIPTNGFIFIIVTYL
jgi:hypothetical protein